LIRVSVDLPNQDLSSGQKLREIRLELNQPGFVAILGRNGSGKSTLLHALSGLLLCKGEIFFSSPPAYLPQHMPVPWGLTSKEVVAMGAYKHMDWRTPSNFEKADSVLNDWGLSTLIHQEVATLSGGERQLIWLAQMEMQKSEILLLDEPTQYLDVYFQSKVFDWMKAQAESGKLILCVTHQLEYVGRMQGLMLNLSEKKPTLVEIDQPSLSAVRAAMERN
jgi:iron complex transport system ATP-binding protein